MKILPIVAFTISAAAAQSLTGLWDATVTARGVINMTALAVVEAQGPGPI